MGHRTVAAAAILLLLAGAAFADIRPVQTISGGGAIGTTSVYRMRGVVTTFGNITNSVQSAGGPYVLRHSFYPAVVAYVPNRNAADADWLALADAPDFDDPRPLPEEIHSCNLKNKAWNRR